MSQDQKQAVLPGAVRGTPVRVLATLQGSQLQPRLIALDGANAADAWNVEEWWGGGVTNPDRLPVKVLRIQNVSNQVVYYAKNTTASAASYHGILKAGAANKDGNGGMIDLAGDQPSRVSLFSAAAANVIVDVVYENP